MARRIELTPNKTYASEVNAIKAVEKLIPPETAMEQTYYIAQQGARYFPVFIGERALKMGLQFHFNIIA